MVEVPQIVRDRLIRQAMVGEHPDANLLSAFAEHALTQQERAEVLDHLSLCAACREILALSAPEVKEARQAAAAAGRMPAGARLSWWRSPVVHWGALTAAALVVLIAVGERMRLREGHSASAPAIAKVEVAQSASAHEAASAPPESKESWKSAPGALAAVGTSNRPESAGSTGRLAGKDRLAMSKGVPAKTASQKAPPSPRPAALPTKSDFEAGKTDGPQSENGFEYGRLRAAPSATASGQVGMAGAAPGPKSEATVLSQGRSAMLAKRPSLGTRWSISNSGSLQRSFDGGRSWNAVAVVDGVKFRAVATVGPDVWAGGSNGVLYHSADGGERWSEVRVQANGRALSGNIVRIEFSDIQNGVVTTSTGETWATSDSGATWRCQ